jgi:hypothetical protein
LIFEGIANSVLKTLLITGKEVTIIMCMAEKKKISALTKSQNSLEVNASSFLGLGISFILKITKMIDGIIKTNNDTTSCPDMPMSVKECTDESPKIPLLVRKEEYWISKNESINIK